MTWTYATAPGTGTAAGRRDAIRLRVGDTDTNDQQLQDEEIAFFLLQSSNDITFAALRAAEALAGRFARQVAVSQGPASFGAQDRYQHYRDLAAAIEEEIRREGAEFFAGGRSKADKRALDDDTDLVQPAFAIGQDDITDPLRRRDEEL